MNILEAVANWYGCPYGLKNCRDNCPSYMMVDPRPDWKKGVGPSTKGQRTITLPKNWTVELGAC